VGEGRIRSGKTSGMTFGRSPEKRWRKWDNKILGRPPDHALQQKASQPASQPGPLFCPWNRTPKAHRDPLTTNPPDLRVSPRVALSFPNAGTSVTPACSVHTVYLTFQA
jgi:hypothetical protein